MASGHERTLTPLLALRATAGGEGILCLVDPIKEVANKLSGIFVREQTKPAKTEIQTLLRNPKLSECVGNLLETSPDMESPEKNEFFNNFFRSFQLLP